MPVNVSLGNEIDSVQLLANTDILFASPNFSTRGSETRNLVDDTMGFAIGYQGFWDNKRAT